MADFITICGALLTLLGFLVLFWFIKRLGILELEAELVNVDFQRPKMDPQPMIEVKNPFEITMSSSNMLIGCVETVLNCTEMCTMNCYWKVKKELLEKRVLESQRERIPDENDSNEGNNLPGLQTILRNNCESALHSEFFDICSGKKIIHNIKEISERSVGKDGFISNPLIYDLVVHVELTKESQDQIKDNPCSISAMLVGVHLKIDQQHFKPQVIQQYVQSVNGKLFQMKKLFMEGDISKPLSPTDQEDLGHNLCVVCQLMPISRALIPCGHACLCILCFDKMNSCPMCRHTITSSFILREEPNIRDTDDDVRFSDLLRRMNPLEIIRGIYNAS